MQEYSLKIHVRLRYNIMKEIIRYVPVNYQRRLIKTMKYRYVPTNRRMASAASRTLDDINPRSSRHVETVVLLSRVKD